MSYTSSQEVRLGQRPDASDGPLHEATIAQAFTRFWKRYATFSGRASRSEYWWMALISLTVAILTTSIDVVTNGGFAEARTTTTGVGDLLSYAWGLATIVPTVALGVRRLHDTNRSGNWILLGLVPFIGVIVVLIFSLAPSHPAGARFDRASEG
ncbi:MAG TPA: DUF805 domain-containing protein [Propionibacteriaceae bacterium]|jgi:uncharacterized membrane protein YhaH (DUF805 family)